MTGRGKKLPPLSAEEESALRSDPGSDPQSVQETKQLSSGLPADEIERRSKEREAERTERFREHFERLAVWTLYVVWMVLCALLLVWVYHLVAPPSFWRLPDEQVGHIQSILTGGLLTNLAGGHLKRRLESQ